MVFDRPFRLVALITPLLVRVQQHVERLILTFESVRRQLTTPVSAIRSISKGPTRAESAGPHPAQRSLRICRLQSSEPVSGTRRSSLELSASIPGCQSANHSCRRLRRWHAGSLFAQAFRRRLQVIGTHGIGLGGDHIDQLMFKKCSFLSGQGRTLAAGRLRPGN